MTKQEKIIQFLNNNMIMNQPYSYSDILKWSNHYKMKEGTLTSVLTKSKGVQSMLHNELNGERTRVRLIKYDEIRAYDKEHYKKISNASGVTQKICNKVKSLKAAGFNKKEVTSILKLTDGIVKDIVSCKYNIHKYNELFRKNNPQLASKTSINEPFLQSLESLKDAVTATITAFREYGL